MKRTAPIDWEQVHERLQTARAALDENLSPSAETMQRRLLEGAALLARRRRNGSNAGALVGLLIVRVGQTRYGLRLSDTRGVQRLAHCSPAPGAADCVFGIIAERGEVWSLLDARRLLGDGEDATGGDGFVVHLHAENRQARIRVDGLEEAMFVPVEVIRPSENAAGERHVEGYTQDGLPILRAAALLDAGGAPSGREHSPMTPLKEGSPCN